MCLLRSVDWCCYVKIGGVVCLLRSVDWCYIIKVMLCVCSIFGQRGGRRD